MWKNPWLTLPLTVAMYNTNRVCNPCRKTTFPEEIPAGNFMATTLSVDPRTSDVAIFGRLLDNHKGEMAVGLARYVLTLGFSEAEQARMRELADMNQKGGLSAAEHEELMAYVKAGHLLALLQSKARKALKKRKVS
jgi:hypothetical protein